MRRRQWQRLACNQQGLPCLLLKAIREDVLSPLLLGCASLQGCTAARCMRRYRAWTPALGDSCRQCWTRSSDLAAPSRALPALLVIEPRQQRR